ncbi:MAG: DUF1330 domain-containing protein [Thermodesulfobacteriota bacterium]
MDMKKEKLYAVRLLWIKDPRMFAKYQELAKPILAKHGVYIERWLVTESIEGDGLEKPDEIVITRFENTAAKEAFETDPEFKKAARIRDKAAKLVTITAKSVFGD